MERIISEKYAGRIINGPVTGDPIKFDRDGVGQAAREDVLKLVKHPKGYYRLPEGQVEAIGLDAALEAFIKARDAVETAANGVEVAAAAAAAIDRPRAASKLEAAGLDIDEVLGSDEPKPEPEEPKAPEPKPEVKAEPSKLEAEIDGMHHNAARALAKKLGGDPQSTDEARLFLKQQPPAEVRAAIEEARG